MRGKVNLKEKRSIGQIIADKATSVIGSWGFIITQSCIIAFWITANVQGWLVWDAYPFIFLNLALSFQAAYTAPIIMMSQAREAQRDRARAEADYKVNLLAEKEIEQILGKLLLVEQHLVDGQGVNVYNNDLAQIKNEILELKQILKK